MNTKKKNNLLTLAIFALVAIILPGCIEDSDYEKQQQESDQLIKDYITSNNIEAEKSNNGVYYEALTSNPDGELPKIGDVMKVKYELRTLDGKLLESHMTDSTLLRFSSNAVIPSGVNYGLDILREGEKIRCYLPSYLAYNSYSVQDEFGPNANFILDIELTGTATEDDIHKMQIDEIEAYIDSEKLGDLTPSTSGLYFKSLEAGTGDEAKAYHTATLHYKRKTLDGSIIQETEADNPLIVSLNTNQLVSGFREGVLKMKEGEKALLILPSDIAFGSSVKVIPNSIREELWENGLIGSLVEPYTIVMYEVELLEVK
ncbi:FKBP-type peptidyl-prolyl cis-trans isomerase [Reichenbachiella carrageenanivorans]|uniref:Peptidyl-prolyl cis-trans isomerase n=1 Tax=Reichenbachiella carrageenanivorans TaxID=2979869 RepID=A0ABY6CXP9_9BACT|nr:FKBP-type peptidyl-prolyl cis-trans isomerase [Reichenbachiella carrageenanivorans]UXX78691.1 FKBP-type peptidyl-prolyl cis-trans isomerase [Reichenbachiella carrageenanivorans]